MAPACALQKASGKPLRVKPLVVIVASIIADDGANVLIIGNGFVEVQALDLFPDIPLSKTVPPK